MTGIRPTSVLLAEILGDVRAGFASGDDIENGVLQFRMNNVDREGAINFSSQRRVPLDLVTDDLLLQPGDILFNATNSPDLVGKTALFKGRHEPVTFSNHFLRLKVRTKIGIPDYLAHYLKWSFSRGTFQSMSRRWVNQATVNRDQLLGMPIPLPSIEKQRRIAAILDQAESLRAKRRQALAKLDTLAQSLFHSLSKTKSHHISLKDLVTFKTGKLDSNAAEADGQYPFFTCAKEDAFINVYAFDQEALLLAGNNAAGEYSVKHYKGKFNAYQRTYVISVDESQCTYEYAKYALQSKLLELKYQSKGTGTKYLTLEILNRLKLAIPSVQDQRDFSQRIEQAKVQEASILKSELQLRQLQTSLEQRAFLGEL